MTAMKPVLDLFIDANILLFLAFCLWRGAQALIARSGLRHDYGRQLTLLKTVLFITFFSPFVAYVCVLVSRSIAPGVPLTVGDIAVAAYLKGEIAIPAIQFESLLNTRIRVTEVILDGSFPWIVGILALLSLASLAHAGRLVWSILCVRQALRNSYLWRHTSGTDIRISDTVCVPFAARGLFRRHVVLPSSLMTHRKELRLVLAHEFQHLRAGDVEWEFAFEAMRPLLFWNPAFVLWKRSFDHLRELSCDQAVMSSYRIAPHDYAQCLLDFCERRVNGTWPKAMNVAFVRAGAKSSRKAFENRILAIYEAPNGGHGAALLNAMLFVLAIGISLAAASVRQPGDWSHDRLMLSTIVNLERLEAINQTFTAGFGVQP